MTKLIWDKTGERLYETGVDHGVLYIPDVTGLYTTGVAWNGLTTVTESPSGAEANPLYADNMKYLNLVSAEEFGATIEAYTYPPEFGQFDGTNSPAVGLYVGQQSRKSFGFSYRTRVGNDVDGSDYGYKLHLVYNAQASPSEKAYGTINDSPDAITFSWDLTTTPVYAGDDLKPTAQLTINSTQVDSDALAALEVILYGSATAAPRLPLPEEVIGMFTATQPEVKTVEPPYNATTHTITIPSVTGVIYSIGGVDKAPASTTVITQDTVVKARPAPGYKFTSTSDNDWTIDFS